MACKQRTSNVANEKNFALVGRQGHVVAVNIDGLEFVDGLGVLGLSGHV